jgi:predicted ribonuclease YlaK
MTVISELDEKKYHYTKKIRKRAERILKELSKYRHSSSAPEIRDGVSIQFTTLKPDFDWVAERLDQNSGDDRIIAHVLEFMKEKDDIVVTMATADLGFKLKCDGKHIHVTELPESLQEAIVGPQDKKIRELNEENLKLRKQLPALSLKLWKDSQELEFYNYPLYQLSSMSNEDIEASIEEAKEKVKRDCSEFTGNLVKTGPL